MEKILETAEAQARRLANVYEEVTLMMREGGASQRLTASASEAEWSAMQILGHVTEMIPYWLHHCRTLIATSGEPPPFGRQLDSPERLEGVERGATSHPDQLIQLLREEIQRAVAEIRSMSPAEREKKGLHVRRGEMTVAEIVEAFIVAHAEEHMRQLRAALKA